MKKRTGSLAAGGLLIAGIGYLAGILTAPKSGKETRRDIQRTMSRAKSESERKLKQLHSELGELLTSGKRKARSASSKAMITAQAALDNAKAVLSAAHEGEADDKDLDKAVKEASQALKHLKEYLKKNAKNKKA